MSKEELIKDIKEMLKMIFDSYGVLNHYQVELMEDTLKDCLKYLGDKESRGE